MTRVHTRGQALASHLLLVAALFVLIAPLLFRHSCQRLIGLLRWEDRMGEIMGGEPVRAR